MPDLTPKERLQPALLERLRDDERDKTVESRDKRVISSRELHASVKRDLAWLLNTTYLKAAQEIEGRSKDGYYREGYCSLDEYEYVVDSVVNYGVPDLSGRTLRNADIPALRKAIEDAVHRFEPRILRRSLEVDVFADQSEMSHNRLTFVIRGDLWAYPIPLELLLRTEVDLETGDVTVTEGGM